jgi:hypothetical protein
VFQDFTPADKLDHHPEWLNVYRLNVDENVEVTLSTDEGPDRTRSQARRSNRQARGLTRFLAALSATVTPRRVALQLPPFAAIPGQ